MLITPLVVFLRFQSYSLVEMESIAAVVFLGLLGAVFGLVMEAFGAWSRALMFALLITLTVDIQSTSPERIRLLLTTFAVTLAVTALLRHALPRWGTAVLVVSLLLSSFGPTSRSDIGLAKNLPATTGDPQLPIIVHLILDEQIGVEGIPEEFDPEGFYARSLRDLYLEHGFRVFGRAFSHYYNTYNTIPNLLNFDVPRATQTYAQHLGSNWFVTRNAYFAEMSERGYAIRVIQSKYLDFLKSSDDSNIEWAWTFDPEQLSAIRGTPLSTYRKMRLILGMYARLSLVATTLDVPIHQVTPIATLPVLDLLRREIEAAPPGTLFFAHLLLPHGPYGLTENCDVRPDPDDWLLGYDPKMHPRRNNKRTRSLRYPLYLQQMQCLIQRLDDFLLALEQLPHGDSAIVVIHGDHGSRLDCGPPKQRFASRLNPSDWTDGFSTLFAIKHPHILPGYDRRIVSLDQLFAAGMRDGAIPDGTEWIESPEVLLEQRSIFKPHPLPVFERVLTGDSVEVGGL